MAYRRIENAWPANTGEAAIGSGCRYPYRAFMDSASTGRRRNAAPGAIGRPYNSRGARSRGNRTVGDGSAKPYAGSRIARLIGEGLVDSGADAGILDKPVHAERVEILLAVIAAALTRKQPKEIAPWLFDAPTVDAMTRVAQFANAMKGIK